MDEDRESKEKLAAIGVATEDVRPSLVPDIADAVLARISVSDDALDRISRATEDLDVSPRLSDATLELVELEQRLSQIAASTATVTPSRDFTDAVVRRIERQRRSSVFPDGMMRSARSSLFVAALAAAAAVALSWYTEEDAAADVISTVEIEDSE
jgi:hypothetical protein